MDQVHLRTDLPQTIFNYRQCYRINTHISKLFVLQQSIDDEISDAINLCRGAGVYDASRIHLLDDGWSFYERATADPRTIVDS